MKANSASNMFRAFFVVAFSCMLSDRIVSAGVTQGIRGGDSEGRYQGHQTLDDAMIFTTADEICGAGSEINACDLPRGVEGFVVCRTRVSPRTQKEVASFSKCVPTERGHPTDKCGCCEGDEDCL